MSSTAAVTSDGAEITLVCPGRALPGDAEVDLIPGNKSVRADLDVVQAERLHFDRAAHLEAHPDVGRSLGLARMPGAAR